MKERNYTIEFYRFMFAINFILVHAIMIFPLGYMGFTMSAAHESIILHEQGKCSCSYFVKPRLWCATHRYFSMELEISDFIAEFTLIKEENEA